jgi:hypothetical protein
MPATLDNKCDITSHYETGSGNNAALGLEWQHDRYLKGLLLSLNYDATRKIGHSIAAAKPRYVEYSVLQERKPKIILGITLVPGVDDISGAIVLGNDTYDFKARRIMPTSGLVWVDYIVQRPGGQ